MSPRFLGDSQKLESTYCTVAYHTLWTLKHRFFGLAQAKAWHKDFRETRLQDKWIRNLSFAKMLAGRRINVLQPCFGAQSAITLAHGQPVLALVRSTRSPFFAAVGNLYWKISRCGNSSPF